MPDIRLRGNLNIVPTQATDTLNLGEANRRFNNIYVKTVNADDISAPISGTTSDQFQINTDALADNPSNKAVLSFKSGNTSGTAVSNISYDATKSKFEAIGSWQVDYALVLLKDTQNANVTLNNASCTIQLLDATTAPFAVTLPTAANVPGVLYTFKKIDNTANAITITPNGAETIDGAASDQLNAQWDLLRIISDGTNWLVI